MLDINKVIRDKKAVVEGLATRHDPSIAELVEKVIKTKAGSDSTSQLTELLRSWRNTLSKIRAYFVRDERFFEEFAEFGHRAPTFFEGLKNRYQQNPSFFQNLKTMSQEDANSVNTVEGKAMRDRDFMGELGEEVFSAIQSVKISIHSKSKLTAELEELLASGDEKRFELTLRDIRRWSLDMKRCIQSMEAMGSRIKTAIQEANQNANEHIPPDLLRIPNIPHKDVPVGANEGFNKEIDRVGTVRDFNFDPQSHWNLLPHLMDSERAVHISGSRFSLLRGHLARLERSLVQLMLDTHADKFEEVSPPFLVSDRSMINSGQLPKFGEELYRLGSDGLYLIPTAEVSLVNIGANRIFKEDELPLRLCAATPCFRREAGAAGRDNKGLIRQHQFHKVELVSICSAQDVDREFGIIENAACRVLDILKLPYRKVMLCTGDLGFSAEKTVDLEVWMPGFDAYREISSISSCGDFQGRRMKGRIKKQDGTKEWVSTLNGSGLAVGRTLAAVLENYQREDGSVEVPEALVYLMGGLKEIA